MLEISVWVIIAINSGLVGIVVWALLLGRGRKAGTAKLPEDAGAVFLFDGGVLTEMSMAAVSLLPPSNDGRSDWDRFLAVFSKRFPHLEERLSRLGGRGFLAISAADGTGDRMEARYWSGLVRIEIHEGRRDKRVRAGNGGDFSLVADLAPDPMWMENAGGTITWANAAYLALVDRLAKPGTIPTWPPTRLFETVEGDVTLGAEEEARRYRLSVREMEDGAACVAHDITEIEAEARNRTAMIGAVGSAFSTLSTGLALFGSDRRLCSFNPALCEVLGVKPELLTHKPTIEGFLGLLRDEKILPEPTNYSAWRQTVVAIEAGAEEGSYNEDWVLPDDRTLRVSGRPQTSGSCALLFEDISPQLAAARMARRLNMIWKDALEQSKTPLLLLADTGKVLAANSAYCSLWGVLPSECESFDGQKWIWRQKSLSREAFDALPNRVPNRHETLPVTGPDGMALRMNIKRISGGASVVSFDTPETETGSLFESEVVAVNA